jgi:hypothetical protein
MGVHVNTGYFMPCSSHNEGDEYHVNDLSRLNQHPIN